MLMRLKKNLDESKRLRKLPLPRSEIKSKGKYWNAFFDQKNIQMENNRCKSAAGVWTSRVFPHVKPCKFPLTADLYHCGWKDGTGAGAAAVGCRQRMSNEVKELSTINMCLILVACKLSSIEISH